MKRSFPKKTEQIFRKILIAVTGFVIIYTLCVALACVPGLLILSDEKTTAFDGITTLADAVHTCQETGLKSWELVEYAQKLTARKFMYSRRHSWESAEKAFARGQGYCVQQALALKKIYDKLQIDAKVVHGRGDFPETIIHGVREPGGNFNHFFTFSGAIIVNAARDFRHTRFRRQSDSSN